MSTRVTVTCAEGGVVAVKSATGPEQIAVLALEASRLQQACHPGVVAFVDHRVREDRAELWTRFAGEPLGCWRGTPAGAAGLVAAVAATVADLHELGLVHGRIDLSHVVLDVDGRPRLCGWTPPPADAGPPEDVAALGHLLEALVERAGPPAGVRPSWFLWPRARAADHRALSQVISHAIDAVPTRRPTAGALARSILSAVPGAELAPAGPTPPAAPTPSPDRPSPIHAPADPLPAVAATPAPDRRSVGRASTGPAPAVAAPPTPDPPPIHPPPELVASTAFEAFEALDSLDDPDEGFNRLDPEVDAIFGDQTTAELDELFVDRSWDDRAGDGPVSSTHRRGGVFVGGAVVLGFAVAAAGAYAVRTGLPSDVGAQEPAVPPAPDEARPCAPTDTGDTAGQPDVDGDGCPDVVVVNDRVVEAAGQRWALGEPGDKVAVGDWDCDGVATPAVYRPSSGDVFVFSDWATADEPLTAEAVARVAGGRAVTRAAREPGTGRPAPTPCDALGVELNAGGQRIVDLAP